MGRPRKQKTNYGPLITIHLPEGGWSVDHIWQREREESMALRLDGAGDETET
jgi:hypothetical protein